MNFLNDLLNNIENKEEIIEKIKGHVAENYVPKRDFNSKNEEFKQLKNHSKDLQDQLENLKANNIDNEKLTKQIEALQSENKKKEQQYKSELAAIKKNNAIEKYLSQSELKVKDVDVVKLLLNDEEINFEDNKLSGIKEQVENLKKEKAFLFESENKNNENKNRLIFDGFNIKDSSNDTSEQSLGLKLATTRNKETDIKDPWS